MLRTTGSPAVGRLAGRVFIFIGVLLMGLGWHLLQQERARVARSVQATGVVESLASSTYQSPVRVGTTSSMAPTIRYHDAAGRAYVFTASAAATRPASYSVGEAVQVYYDPARPYDAQLHGFLAQWLGPAIVLGMGLLVSLLGWLAAAVLGKSPA